MSYLLKIPLRRRFLAVALVLLAALTSLIADGVFSSSPAAAAQPSVGLGTATSFAVLAGSTVTNTGPSVVTGNLGVSPGTAVTGFPPGVVTGGTQHAADAVALQAQSDLTTAYNDAAGRTPATAVPADIGGQTLAPGIYDRATSIGLTGTVTFDAQNDPNAVFVLQAGSTLITASNSNVNLIRGAQACNVYWQVGSSATLGTGTHFIGNVLALTSITVQTNTTVTGRVLARNGQVSLDTVTITRPPCVAGPTPTSTPTVTTSASTASASPTTSTTSTGGGSPGPTTTSGSSLPATSPASPSVTPTRSRAATPSPGRSPTPRRTPPTRSPTPHGHTPGVPISPPGPVPPGFPQTGAGGAAPSSDANSGVLLAGGVVALFGAGATSSQAIRRRKRQTG